MRRISLAVRESKRVRVPNLRAHLAAATAAAILLSLAACSPAQTGAGTCGPAIPSGPSAALVTADGGFGADPKAKFPTPLVAATTELATVSTGDGAQVKPGDTFVGQVTIYDGKSGDQLISTDYTQNGLLLAAKEGTPRFGTVAQCATTGSRVAAAGTAENLIGVAALQQNNLTVDPSATVVMVLDVKGSYLGRANGADQPGQTGFPSVVLAPDGRPGLTFSKDAPPTDLKIATLKTGSGAAVAQGDQVVIAYTGVLWNSTTVFDSTWQKGAPTVVTAASLSDAQGGLVPGFARALIGQKVGSQVIAIIPPDFGYPAGSAPASIPAGSTMVFVFDVLGIVT